MSKSKLIGNAISILTIASFVLMPFVQATPAYAQEQQGNDGLLPANPENECSSLEESHPDGAEWNSEYWKIQISDNELAEIETSGGVSDGDINPSFDDSELTFDWINNHSSYSVYGWLEKSGKVANDLHKHLWENGEGDSDGVDESISHVTICFTDGEIDPSIVVVKEANIETEEEFGFNADWLDDDEDFTLSDGAEWNSGDLADILDEAPFSITENEADLPEGWTLDDVACQSNLHDDPVDNTSIELEDGEVVTCTFTNTYDEPEEITVETAKVVCEDEGDLPNGSLNDVDGMTAEKWASEYESCELVEGWEFEYKIEGSQSNPGGDLYGPAGGDWQTFTDSTNIDIKDTSLVQVREVLQEEYIPFTGEGGNDYTAEFYCTGDAGNYDNWEWLNDPEAGETYYCVGFNAPKPAIELHAQKVMCDAEEYLPDWGEKNVGDNPITGDTAKDWVDQSEGHCELVPWEFEWAQGTSDTPENPGDNTGLAGGEWAKFKASSTVRIGELEEGNDRIWVREVWNDSLVPFTGQNTDQSESAEIYCHTDGLNYDNYDFVLNPEVGEEYNCVAFNAPAEPVEEDPVCEVVIVSDDTNTVEEYGGAFAKLLTDIHSAWTGEFGLAQWIWGDDPVQDPIFPVTQTFNKNFGWNGVVTDVQLEIAADNSYDADLNGNSVGDGTGTTNFNPLEVYNLSTSTINQGNNTFSVEVENTEGARNASSNPAGLLYRLTITGEGESCEIPYEETRTISGYKFHDFNEDGEWNGDDTGIPGWSIVIKPQTLEPIETLEVDSSDDVGETTTNVLNSEKTYLIEVEGDYQFAENSNPDRVADAEHYSNAAWSSGGSDWGADNPTEDQRTLDMVLNDKNIDWGTYNDAHLYKTVMEGNGEVLNARIFERQASHYTDNVGTLEVRIYDVTDWTVQTDSEGYYSMEVPEGEYQVVEMMQDGWVQTAPVGPSYCHIDTEDDFDNACDFGNKELETDGGQCVPGEEYGDSVFEFNQGDQKDGDPVDAGRSDATNALGEPENDDTATTTPNYVSLGFGGDIIIEMEYPIKDGLGDDFRVFETSYGSPDFDDYPEQAEVLVSDDGVTFVSVGITEQGEKEAFDLNDAGLTQARFVKLVDTSDPDEFNGDADGYDLDGIQLLNCEFEEQDEQCLIEGYKYDSEGEPLAGWEIGLAGYTSGWSETGGDLRFWIEGDEKELIISDVTNDNGYYCLEDTREITDMDALYQVGEVYQGDWVIEHVEVSGTTTPHETGENDFFDAWVDVDLPGYGTLQVDFYNQNEDEEDDTPPSTNDENGGGSGGVINDGRGGQGDVLGDNVVIEVEEGEPEQDDEEPEPEVLGDTILLPNTGAGGGAQRSSTALPLLLIGMIGGLVLVREKLLLASVK